LELAAVVVRLVGVGDDEDLAQRGKRRGGSALAQFGNVDFRLGLFADVVDEEPAGGVGGGGEGDREEALLAAAAGDDSRRSAKTETIPSCTCSIRPARSTTKRRFGLPGSEVT
jgi:hypothetical protein